MAANNAISSICKKIEEIFHGTDASVVSYRLILYGSSVLRKVAPLKRHGAAVSKHDTIIDGV